MTLNERIEAAIRRITEGRAPMRIPADETDPDIVLAAAQKRIAELEAQLAQHPERLQETARRVAEAVRLRVFQDAAFAFSAVGREWCCGGVVNPSIVLHEASTQSLDLSKVIAEATK